MEKNELQKVDPDSPAGIMMQLMSNGGGDKFDVEGFGKMLEFQERHEANQAKKVFASAFAVVQSNIDAVVKTKVNPQTKSKYAGLDAVIEMSKPVYTKQGFSIIYYEGKAEKADDVRVYADVLHKAGHKETYHLDVPLGGKGIQGKVNMTAIHAKATSFTYGRRYLLCNIWNIPTQDDDGNQPGTIPTKIPTPNKDEQEVLDAVRAKMLCPPGMRVDEKKMNAILIERAQRYPDDMAMVDKVAKWLSEMDRPEIFIDKPKDEFDEFAETYHEEHDEPDVPPDDLYRCTKCGLDHDTPKKAAECIC